MEQSHSEHDSSTHNENMNCATEQDLESCSPCSSMSHHSVPPKWTRYMLLIIQCHIILLDLLQPMPVQ